MTLVIIPCTRKKARVRNCRAEHLYDTPIFRMKIQWAKSKASTIRILSAKYGLIELGKVVSPYDLRFGQDGCVPLSTLRTQAQTIPQTDRVVVLGSGIYLELCRSLWPNAQSPMTGLPPGKQLRWLKNDLRPRSKGLLDFKK